MTTTRTRFAPSPTGFMHVGNLRTALYAYLVAKSQQGSFVLRIEDTDRNRLVEGAVDVIYKTLKTAGLLHDEGPDVGGNYGPYVQSERLPLYRKYAEQLVQTGHAYYCFCDKTEAEDEQPTDEPSTGYNRHCRNLPPEEIEANLKAGKPYVIRQKMPLDGSTTFHDNVFGDITIENKVLDDQILLKQDGYPTYNFANVIDDHLMAISHVVRGAEYLSSTPKYNLLYQAFGWDIPEYVHLPLIMGRAADGTVSKLSKRHGSVSFENLVAEGYLPEAIINYVALLGWNPKNDTELFTLPQLTEAFQLSGLNKSPAIFDYDKLLWMNGEYIKAMAPEDLARVARPYVTTDAPCIDAHWLKIVTLLQPRMGKFSEINEKIAFLIQQPSYENDLFFNKKSKSNPEKAKAILTDLMPQFKALETWNTEAINGLLSAYAEAHEMKFATAMWAPRIAVSGQTVTPGGAGDIMEILGKDESLRRLEAGLAQLG